jgi:molecular chaperone DnaJ
VNEFYNTLGVESDASQDDIKKSYRKLAKEYHPDKNQGDKEAEEKFKEISEAYSTLSDIEKRTMYDLQQSSPMGGHGFTGYRSGMDVDLDEILRGFGFNHNMGRAPSHHRKQQGITDDTIVTLNVPFGEMKKGHLSRINTTTFIDCEKCDGKGGAERIQCETCSGMGQVRVIQKQGTLVITMAKTCSPCSGAGESIKDPCSECNTTGQIKQNDSYMVEIKCTKE